MFLEIITPDKKVFEGEISGVQFPGSAGSFEVLSNHAPLISSLEKGKIRVRDGRQEKYFNVTGGIVEVLNNKIIVLVPSVS